MASQKLYLVHDNSSTTGFDGHSFAAPNQQSLSWMAQDQFSYNWVEKIQLRRALCECLDQSSDTRSPFITVYTDLEAARNNAFDRQGRGKGGVFIAHIDGRASLRMVYRNVRKLAVNLELCSKREVEEAKVDLEFDCVILHRVPEEAVVSREDI